MMKQPFVAQATEGEQGDRGNERRRIKETYDKRIAAIRDEMKDAEAAGNKREVQKLERQLAAAKARYAGLMKAGRGDSPETDSAKPAAKATAPAATDIDYTSFVEEVYLRTLSRMPSDDERKIAVDAIASASDPVNGLRDVMWALLNTKEFIVNH
jgi:hypothetical protein